MEIINQWLFLQINAPYQPSDIGLFFAKFFAELPMFLIPLVLVTLWFRNRRSQVIAFNVALNVVLSLSISFAISLIWHHNRPFVDGIGLQLIDHSADSSFPSDHITLMASTLFFLFFEKSYRVLSGIIFVLSLFTGWARIYAGVHYPFDILGAYVLAAPTSLLFYKYVTPYLSPLSDRAIKISDALFGRLFKNRKH